MIFDALNISRGMWGNNKGKLVATIKAKGEKTDITMELPDDVGDKILVLAKNAIIDAVESTANDFIFELTTDIPESMGLLNAPKEDGR